MAKLMLVEDDNNLREIYEARLQAEGYTIITAKDGEEALVVAKTEKPDLIIADVMMPKISGFEMLDILRNTESLKSVRVIMLTALGQADDQQRAGKLGADRYLVKSQVTLEDIVKVAHELLDDAPAATPPAAQEAPSPAATTTTTAPTPPAATATAAPAAAEPATPPDTATSAPAPAAPPAATTPLAAPPQQPAEPAVLAAPPASAPVTPVPVVATPPVTPTTPVSDNPPAADPSATAAKDSAAKSDAQSTLQEEASVEAKIEDFVAGATTEAPPPSETASSGSEDQAPSGDTTDSSTAVETTSATPAESAASSDDKLMAQAVNTLETDAAAAPAPEPQPEPVAVATSANIVKPTESAPAKPTAADDASASGPVKVAHKKVITPLDSGPKADLDELLAVEAAKEAQTAVPAPPEVVVSTKDSPPPKSAEGPKLGNVTSATTIVKPAADPEDTPAGSSPSAATPSANDPNDPNSIAL